MIGTIVLFGEQDMPAIIRLLGRCHTAVVHFPIALVAVAAALESWQMIRRRPELARATPVCLAIGALSAVVASLFGWFLDQAEGGGGNLVASHKWVGLATTAAAVIALVLVRIPRRAVLRLTIVGAAGLASVTGYLGGELVFGQNHLFKGVFDDKNQETPRMVASGPEPTRAAATSQFVHPATADSVDFANDVLPILKQNCLRCHGGDKVKGKLSLRNKSSAMKGGASGQSILPGQAEQSPLYTLLVEPKPTMRMPPPKEKQLSKEQVETIRKWIDQGAAWPDSNEVQ
jgi:mono/diheme cytochrome c family protein